MRTDPAGYVGVPLASTPLCTPVEQAVSEHLDRRCSVGAARDMSDYACHHAAILSNGTYAVFAKFSEAGNGVEQFEVELAGLRLLSERAGALVPAPIGIVPVSGGSILVLEAVKAVDRAPRHWRQIGQTLARIHKITWDRFGLERDGYISLLWEPGDGSCLHRLLPTAAG